MSVTLNATGTEQHAATSSSPFSYTGLTVASGSNIGVLVLISSLQGSQSVSAVTCNGSSMTSVATNTQAGTADQSIWGITGVSAGAATISITHSDTAPILVAGIAFNGVDQTGGTTSFPNGAGALGTSAVASVTVTGSAGDMAAAAMMVPTGFSGGATQTEFYLNNAFNYACEGQYGSPSAGSTIFSENCTSSSWLAIGVDVKAAATGDTFANSGHLIFI